MFSLRFKVVLFHLLTNKKKSFFFFSFHEFAWLYKTAGGKNTYFLEKLF